MKLGTEKYEHRGYQINISIHHDEHMGPPWEEHDGHGIVSDWTTRDKQPGEMVLHSDRNSKRYYDFAETMKIAKRDGWGLDTKAQIALAAKLGRELKPGDILHAAVMADFEHLRAWCNDEWCWLGYTTEIETPDGQTIEGGSCWGFDDEEYMLSEAKSEVEHQIERMMRATLVI